MWPKASVERTAKECLAKLSGPIESGDEQAVHGPLSTRHSNVAEVTVLSNENVAFWLPVTGGGANVILVPGGPPR